VRVKICGITSVADGLAAAEAGVDFLGFVLYPPSPRAVQESTVGPIVKDVRRAYPTIGFVGVFVDRTHYDVAQIAARCGLDYVQLHGSEPPAAVRWLRARDLRVIKAIRVYDRLAASAIAEYEPTAFLLDTFVRERPGGTGKTFDWRLARSASLGAPLILAGGLTADNVARAIRVARPWGVDASSGLETAPGRKDHEAVRRFVRAARQADSEIGGI
jgi:phosphoribosylanthranilate isomerase